MATGCDGLQSALAPASGGAERIADLFWWMVGGAVAIWLTVVGLTVYAIYVQPHPHERRTGLLVIFGGAVGPVLVLGGLLTYGLSILPDLVAPAPSGSLQVTVVGEQWWWRVRYQTPDGRTITTANEIHLPAGVATEFQLASADVIHSFWIPSLGGKVDMIPGRRNRLALQPTRPGIFRGACAEYCGDSHAWMSFFVQVHDPQDFANWMEQQARPAPSPTTEQAIRGREVFTSNGCGACHTIRGTSADGVVGPDLTHVGGRLSLAAGRLPNTADDFLRWIAGSQQIKPGVHMPAFGMLPQQQLRDLATYLDGLE